MWLDPFHNSIGQFITQSIVVDNSSFSICIDLCSEFFFFFLVVIDACSHKLFHAFCSLFRIFFSDFETLSLVVISFVHIVDFCNRCFISIFNLFWIIFDSLELQM